MLSVIPVAAYQAGNSDRAAIQAALNAAQPGDTVSFEAKTYSIDGTLAVPTGVDLKGQPNDTTILNFSLSSPSYGMTLVGGASDVTIESLNMTSNYGVIGMYYSGTNINGTTGYSNVHITNNALKFGGGSTANGTAIFGIYGTVANDGLQITSNYFHDSPNSVRDWEIWSASNAHLDYNTLYKVTDGGHTVEPGQSVSVSYNYGVNLRRMGQEIQGSTVGHDLKVVGNTFFDWVNPYYDSFGLSIVNHNSINTLIQDNYLKANIADGSSWGIPDGGGTNRFGYAIEAGGASPMTVDSNTIVGNWIAGVVASRIGVTVSNNAKFGPANWGDWIGEPSIDGYGSEVLTNDTVDRDTADGPQPPLLSDPKYQYNPKLDGTPAAQTPVFTGGDTTGTSTGSTSSPGFGGGDTGTGTTGTGTTTTGSGGTVSTTPQNTGITSSGDTAVGTAVEIDPAADRTKPLGTLGTLTVTPLSPTTAKLTWTQNPKLVGTDGNVPSIALVEVDVESTVGKQHFPSVLYTNDLVSATVINLHAGWKIDFTVSAYTSDAKLYRSGPVTAMMPGSSTGNFSGLLWGGISTVNTPDGL